jgi:hypothetical protein
MFCLVVYFGSFCIAVHTHLTYGMLSPPSFFLLSFFLHIYVHLDVTQKPNIEQNFCMPEKKDKTPAERGWNAYQSRRKRSNHNCTKAQHP